MNLLHPYLKKNKITQSELADELGISRGSLNRKLNQATPFRYSEVVYICKRLNIENPLEVFPDEAKGAKHE